VLPFSEIACRPCSLAEINLAGNPVRSAAAAPLACCVRCALPRLQQQQQQQSCLQQGVRAPPAAAA
jgi:hypothetical protein